MKFIKIIHTLSTGRTFGKEEALKMIVFYLYTDREIMLTLLVFE